MTTTAGFNRLKECSHGVMLYNVNDTYIGRSLSLYGEYSEGEVELFRKFIKPGHLVLDIGANIGVFTLFFAKAVEETGLVIAFEPQRLVFQSLCANIAINSLSNVICRQQAVAETPGQITVPILDQSMPNNFGGVSLGGWEEGEAVAVVTIDDLNLPRCDFMKVDVEGMEAKVLQGAQETIRRFQPVLYVENDRKEHDSAVLGQIKALGYQIHLHQPPLFRKDNFAGREENVFGDLVSGNLICLPEAASDSVPDIAQWIQSADGA